jgi:hypothetical protein
LLHQLELNIQTANYGKVAPESKQLVTLLNIYIMDHDIIKNSF